MMGYYWEVWRTHTPILPEWHNCTRTLWSECKVSPQARVFELLAPSWCHYLWSL